MANGNGKKKLRGVSKSRIIFFAKPVLKEFANDLCFSGFFVKTIWGRRQGLAEGIATCYLLGSSEEKPQPIYTLI